MEMLKNMKVGRSDVQKMTGVHEAGRAAETRATIFPTWDSERPSVRRGGAASDVSKFVIIETNEDQERGEMAKMADLMSGLRAEPKANGPKRDGCADASKVSQEPVCWSPLLAIWGQPRLDSTRMGLQNVWVPTTQEQERAGIS
ncbi:hypothetical protein KFL_003630140 [Klebsormidium nitens]|uniref:Uncharacterized protein n=1 Tax=Klebsormidium nitens TaxID=105231 RepID=A0A1Y1IFQ7_KLENI|nr:hypothetical protein KFL_003630140 [Klebsormidium nitens]|eukprot:GAQ87596.1 hypothetical protein KFL_003630140 [Klebsormidium nitens]